MGIYCDSGSREEMVFPSKRLHLQKTKQKSHARDFGRKFIKEDIVHVRFHRSQSAHCRGGGGVYRNLRYGHMAQTRILANLDVLPAHRPHRGRMSMCPYGHARARVQTPPLQPQAERPLSTFRSFTALQVRDVQRRSSRKKTAPKTRAHTLLFELMT
jgi:hypothetical protein